MKRPFWLGAAVLLMAAACSPPVTPTAPSARDARQPLGPVSLPAGERLRVVVTTTIVGDVVARVGGDAIELTALLRPGADPHTFQPRPSDLAALADAHVVFANGLGLETFLEEALESAGGNRPVILVSEDIQGLEPANENGEVDPHVWLDVRNVMAWVESVRTALGALDPAHAQLYADNAAAYQGQLAELDAWVVAQVATVPQENRELVTNHASFGYFARRYGFEQVGTVYPVSPAAEPSAQDIARLETAIRGYDVPAVFIESTVNPALAEQVARDTGVTLVVLYSGSLSPPGGGAESYIALIQFDVRAIVAALGGTGE
jgi:manganese/iron transport system substrate-binding protein